MPTRDEFAKQIIEEGKKRGKSKEDITSVLQKSLSDFDAKQGGPIKEKGFFELLKGSAQELQQAREAGMSGGDIARGVAGGMIRSQQRNVGREEDLGGFSKGVLGTGRTLAKVMPTTLGIFGNVLGGTAGGPETGRRLGAAGTALGEFTGSAVEESAESFAGIQEDMPGEQVRKAILDSAISGGLDYGFSLAFDKIIAPGFKAVKDSGPIEKITKVIKGPSKKLARAFELSNVGETLKKANQTSRNLFLKALPEETGPREWFSQNVPNDFYARTTTPGGKPVFKGAVEMDRQIFNIEQLLMQPLKAADDKVGVVTTREMIDAVDNSGGYLEKTMTPELAGDVLENSKTIISALGKMSPSEMRIAKSQLMRGTFTKSGLPSTAKSKVAQQHAGLVLGDMLANLDPIIKPLWSEQRKRYLAKNIINEAAFKIHGELQEDFVAGLSKRELAAVGAKFGLPAIAIGAGQGMEESNPALGKGLKILGTAGIALQAPSIVTQALGGPAVANLKTQALGEAAQGVTKKATSAIPGIARQTGRTLLNLVGRSNSK